MPSRHAHGRGAVGTGVTHAVGGETVDVRCGDEPGAVAAEEIGPQLIGHNEEDVGLGHSDTPYLIVNTAGCRLVEQWASGENLSSI